MSATPVYLLDSPLVTVPKAIRDNSDLYVDEVNDDLVILGNDGTIIFYHVELRSSSLPGVPNNRNNSSSSRDAAPPTSVPSSSPASSSTTDFLAFQLSSRVKPLFAKRCPVPGLNHKSFLVAVCQDDTGIDFYYPKIGGNHSRGTAAGGGGGTRGVGGNTFSSLSKENLNLLDPIAKHVCTPRQNFSLRFLDKYYPIRTCYWVAMPGCAAAAGAIDTTVTSPVVDPTSGLSSASNSPSLPFVQTMLEAAKKATQQPKILLVLTKISIEMVSVVEELLGQEKLHVTLLQRVSTTVDYWSYSPASRCVVLVNQKKPRVMKPFLVERTTVLTKLPEITSMDPTSQEPFAVTYNSSADAIPSSRASSLSIASSSPRGGSATPQASPTRRTTTTATATASNTTTTEVVNPALMSHMDASKLPYAIVPLVLYGAVYIAQVTPSRAIVLYRLHRSQSATAAAAAAATTTEQELRYGTSSVTDAHARDFPEEFRDPSSMFSLRTVLTASASAGDPSKLVGPLEEAAAAAQNSNGYWFETYAVLLASTLSVPSQQNNNNNLAGAAGNPLAVDDASPSSATVLVGNGSEALDISNENLTLQVVDNILLVHLVRLKKTVWFDIALCAHVPHGRRLVIGPSTALDNATGTNNSAVLNPYSLAMVPSAMPFSSFAGGGSLYGMDAAGSAAFFREESQDSMSIYNGSTGGGGWANPSPPVSPRSITAASSRNLGADLSSGGGGGGGSRGSPSPRNVYVNASTGNTTSSNLRKLTSFVIGGARGGRTSATAHEDPNAGPAATDPVRSAVIREMRSSPAAPLSIVPVLQQPAPLPASDSTTSEGTAANAAASSLPDSTDRLVYYLGTLPLVLDRTTGSLYCVGINATAMASAAPSVAIQILFYLNRRYGRPEVVSQLLSKLIHNQAPLHEMSQALDVVTAFHFRQAILRKQATQLHGTYYAGGPPFPLLPTFTGRPEPPLGVFECSLKTVCGVRGISLSLTGHNAAMLLPAVVPTVEDFWRVFLKCSEASLATTQRDPVTTSTPELRATTTPSASFSSSSSGGPPKCSFAAYLEQTPIPQHYSTAAPSSCHWQLDPHQLFRGVFEPLLNRVTDHRVGEEIAGAPSDYFSEYALHVLLEYARSLMQLSIKLTTSLQCAIMNLYMTSRNPNYFGLHQLLMYRAMDDDLQTATQLIAMEHRYPAAFHLGLDMLTRLRANDDIIQVFLARGAPLEAAKHLLVYVSSFPGGPTHEHIKLAKSILSLAALLHDLERKQIGLEALADRFSPSSPNTVSSSTSSSQTQTKRTAGTLSSDAPPKQPHHSHSSFSNAASTERAQSETALGYQMTKQGMAFWTTYQLLRRTLFQSVKESARRGLDAYQDRFECLSKGDVV